MTQERTIGGGRFVLDEPIGKGGVGEVWRAHGATGGRKFALKLLRPEYAQHPQLRRRFAREARAASRLSHPNLVTVYAFGNDADEQLYIAMELAEGPSVAHAVKFGLSFRNILELADRLLAGLAHAHARGVIHRDLKPDNVLLDGADLPDTVGTPKIVDFGIATVPYEESLTSDRDTQQGEVVGTPRYMSPEQAMGERNLGPRTDIYNVGLMLYELISGKPPFGDDSGLAVMSRHVHEEIPPLEPRPGLNVPEELIAIVERALEKKALDRWSSAGEMRVALQELLVDARKDPGSNEQPTEIPGPPPGLVDEDSVNTRPDSRPDLIEATRTEPDAEAFPELDLGFGPWSFRVPFVGRQQERRKLRKLADDVLETGRGGIVLLEGEAGVGKSRLCRWFREQLEERGVFRANTGAFIRGGTESLRGVQEVLESMFRTRGLPRERLAPKVAERLREWGHDSPEDAAALIDFLRPTGIDETRPNTVSTDALFALIARILEMGARRKPRLIVLDDIHWAGRELADFLEYLAVELRHRSIPLIIVATIRTEDLAERPELETRIHALSRFQGESVHRWSLDRLETVAGRDLVTKMLPCDEELAAVILERAGGNPLHLLMLLRYMREESLLEWKQGQWHARDPDAIAQVVPPSLGDLFQVRIEQAESHYNVRGLFELLQLAAIVGFRFHYDVLRLLNELNDGEFAEYFEYDLDRLLAEGFIVESEGRDDWYAFSHGLLRDYLVRETGPASAKRLHRLAAQAWENTRSLNTEANALEIARHWKRAGEADEALRWYLRAGEAARRSFVLRQAMHAYESALGILDEKLGIETNTNEPLGQGKTIEDFRAAGVAAGDYLAILSYLGDLHEGFGEYRPAEIAYRRVVRMVSRDTTEFIDPLGWSWLGLGHIAWQRGDFEAAEWAFRKVREIVRPFATQSKLDGEAARGLARVAWHRGEYETAQKLAEDAHAIAEKIDHTEGQAEASWIQGEIERILGHSEQAREHYAESMSLYRTMHHPTGMARNFLSLAQVARYQKDFPAARDLYSRALSHFQNLGDRRGEGQCLNGLGDIARFEDRHDEADRCYARALEIYEGIGAEYDIAVALANLGLNSIALQDYESAEGYLESALTIIGAGDYPYLLAGVEYNLALVHALRGRADSDEIRSVVDMAERLPIADLDYAQPLEHLATLRADAGDWDEAIALWEKARDIYDDLGLHDDRDRVDAALRGEFE